MISFSESLQLTNNSILTKQLFGLMSERNVDPMKFVDWYMDFGITHQSTGDLKEAGKQWLSAELILNENLYNRFAQGQQTGSQVQPTSNWANKLGQTVGNVAQTAGNWAGQASTRMQHAQQQFQSGIDGGVEYARQAEDAEKALNALHRRLGVSSQLMNNLGGQQFMQTVLELIQMLRNPSQLRAQSPQPQQVQPQAPQQPSVQPATESYINDIKLKNEIRFNLNKVQKFGINPKELVEWYAENSINENIFHNAGEWLGNQWANTKGTFNRWANGEEKQAWGADAQRRVAQKNAEAITSAMQSLSTLQTAIGSNINPDFAKMLNVVVQKLQSANNTQSQSDQQDTGEQPSNGQNPWTTASQQNPASQEPEQPQEPEQLQEPSNSVDQWKTELGDPSQLMNIDSKDPVFVNKAMHIFNNLPSDKKDQIDQYANMAWRKKVKDAEASGDQNAVQALNNQGEEQMNQDKALAMKMLAMGTQSHLEKYKEWLRRKGYLIK